MSWAVVYSRVPVMPHLLERVFSPEANVLQYGGLTRTIIIAVVHCERFADNAGLPEIELGVE